MDVTLHTSRLVLRRFRADDLGSLEAFFGDPEVMRYVGSRREPWTAEEIRTALARVDAHWDEHGFGPLAVVERVVGAVVGECGLQLLEGGPNFELAYTLAREVWGRGYATEAAAAVLAWGFGTVGLDRVVAVVDPDNLASRRVVEKIGMRRLGTRLCYGAELVEFALEAAERGARRSEGEGDAHG